MTKRFNIWSFNLVVFCLIATLHLIYSTIFQTWSVAPPSYILWLLTVLTFIFGIIGFKDKSNKISKVRSWITVIVSVLLSFVLFLGVLRVLLISEELIGTAKSPKDDYSIHFYLTNGGATTSLGVLGILDGPLWFEKTIYDDYNMDHADVEWINDYTVLINNHQLNLKDGETYSD
jgi:hypothetical protein